MKRSQIIINADDLGAHPSMNRAFVNLIRQEVKLSGSLLAVGCAFDDAVAQFQKFGIRSVGAHLAVTSEYPALPYYPRTPSLREQMKGKFGIESFPSSVADFIAAQVPADLVRRELQAQIDALLHAGLKVSHLDGHMFFYEPGVGSGELLAAVQELAAELKVPLREWNFRERSPVEHRFFVWSEADTRSSRFEYYRQLFSNPPPGLSEVIIHPADSVDELARITRSAAWRFADYEFFRGAEFRELMSSGNAALVSHEEIS